LQDAKRPGDKADGAVQPAFIPRSQDDGEFGIVGHVEVSRPMRVVCLAVNLAFQVIEFCKCPRQIVNYTELGGRASEGAFHGFRRFPFFGSHHPRGDALG
jgi:hypothetical protein